MRAFEARAIENITTAPATAFDRRGASVTAAALLALFVLTVPFAHLELPRNAAYVPALSGAAVVALMLTAVLLYVQYRIERDLKLALLWIAYAAAAVLQALYLITFPGVLSTTGLLGAGSQTASAFYLASQVVFAGFLFAEGIAARRNLRASRDAVRVVAGVTAAALLAFTLFATLDHAALPVFTNGVRFAPAMTMAAAPLAIALLLAALFVASGGLRTVTEVWLGVVLLARCIAFISAGELGAARFSFGWYASRIEELTAAVVVLAVFLFKINELMLRLAARSISTAEALAVGEARYGALANVVPQLIWTAGAGGEVEYVNDRWVAYTGLDAAASREKTWRAVVHPDHELQVRDRWLHALRTGEPFAAEYRLREGATGRYRWFLINVVPVRGRRAEIVTWIGTCTDIDAQKRLEEREAFLSRAGERLGASLDVTATVNAIKTLLVPKLADRTWVALIDDDGRYALAGLGSNDLSDELDARRWIGTPLQPALHDVIAALAETGEPIVIDRPEQFPDPWVRELPPGGAVLVPLHNGDVRIGVLAAVRTSGRVYDPDEVSLMRELARRAALSLEHARLYERERTTADALQRAMLPAQLPQLPDIRFSASYSAASESQRVGGDFYDAFTLPDGRVAVTIGDVTGHGLEAAVVMGEIRQAIRASAFEFAEPSTILDRASRLLVASGRTLFVTAIFGMIDPKTGRFTYATAGHPPPLLDEGGGMLRRLPAAGLPIGLRDEEGVDFAMRLQAPSTLVLYTDGLLEFARDIEDGERRIEAAIRKLANEDIDHLAAALMKDVLGDDEPSDDIAILTVTFDRFAEPLPGREREWRFWSDDARTGILVRREVGDVVSAWTARDDMRYASELTFGELLGNAVRHAPGAVRVAVCDDGAGTVTLVVEDSGPGFTPVAQRLDPYAESGRGLPLVGAFADGLRFETNAHGGTRVVATFLTSSARDARAE